MRIMLDNAKTRESIKEVLDYIEAFMTAEALTGTDYYLVSIDYHTFHYIELKRVNPNPVDHYDYDVVMHIIVSFGQELQYKFRVYDREWQQKLIEAGKTISNIFKFDCDERDTIEYLKIICGLRNE